MESICDTYTATKPTWFRLAANYSSRCLTSTFVMSLNCKSIYFNLCSGFPPPPWRNSPYWTRASSFSKITITHTHTTLGRTPLEEWSACCRDPILTTLKIHVSPVAFEPAISTSERPHAYSLDRAATWINFWLGYFCNFEGNQNENCAKYLCDVISNQLKWYTKFV